MGANGVQQERKKKEKVEVCGDFPVYVHLYVMNKNLHASYEAVTFDPYLSWDHQNPRTFWTWVCSIYAAPLPLRPFVLSVDYRDFHDAVVPTRKP